MKKMFMLAFASICLFIGSSSMSYAEATRAAIPPGELGWGCLPDQGSSPPTCNACVLAAPSQCISQTVSCSYSQQSNCQCSCEVAE